MGQTCHLQLYFILCNFITDKVLCADSDMEALTSALSLDRVRLAITCCAIAVSFFVPIFIAKQLVELLVKQEQKNPELAVQNYYNHLDFLCL